MRCSLVFGKNWRLSLAEALAFLDKNDEGWKFVDLCDEALVIDTSIDAKKLCSSLGGILKVVLVEREFSFQELSVQQFGDAARERLSFYGRNDIGRQLKKIFPMLARQKEYTATELVRHDMKENALVFALKSCYFGPTIAVADYRSFRKRDEARPLKPALGIAPSRARILVNLTRAQHSLLDPFCGHGTILQEACLAGVKDVLGSDIDSNAIRAAHKNMEWSKKTFNFDSRFSLKQCDARQLEKCWKNADCIATEPALGPRLETPPSRSDAEQIIRVISRLYYKFFSSARNVLSRNGRIVIVLPAINAKKRKVFVEKKFPGFRPVFPFIGIPNEYRDYLGLKSPFMVDEEREPGKKRVVAREFCIFEKI
ncbi:hypothetical protein HY546_01405 [archaeon]|nr:hypothetical protein [archaeon]